MSRWWAETLRIALAPGEAALLHPHGTRLLTSPERSAASLLPLLDEALGEAAWRSRRVEIVLSQHFVRHVLTSPPGKALRRKEEMALVAASLRDIYGDAVNQWRVDVHSQPPQYGLVGAAIDAALAEGLDALLARHGFRNAVIRPLSSFAARRLPAKLEGWWVLAEPGWVSVFAGSNGAWQHLVAQPADAEWVTSLPQWVEREAALAALALPAGVWIQALGVGRVSVPLGGNGRWQMLPHDSLTRGTLALAEI